MKLRKSRQFRKGRIEIIPMIDVMFFLLATFMLASLSLSKLDALPVNLPRGQAERLDAARPVTLTLTRQARIYINRTPVTLATLAATLKPLLRGPAPGLVVSADDDAPQGVVVRAMLKAREAGVRHFLIAVRHE
ncbi:MAG: biopolymer transporter ExbD [Betaproteobacteria bacterium]|nr:biopolymer transporter ExbD [Betaproteobacteria bacterium]